MSQIEAVPLTLDNSNHFDPLFNQYLKQCEKLGVRDLCGVSLSKPCLGSPLTGHERDALTALVDLTSYRLYRACVDLEERHLCPSCWLQQPHCVCHSMPTNSMSGNYRVVLLMHDGEFARASNTGKIALRAGMRETPQLHEDSHEVRFGTNNSLLLFPGVKSHENALKDICASDPYGQRTVLLFPSADALSVEQFQSSLDRMSVDKSNHTKEILAVDAKEPITIIALEGTYSSAKPLLRLIPSHIPRVKVEPLVRSSKFVEWRESMRSRFAANLKLISDTDVHRNGKLAHSGEGSLFASLRRQPMEERLSTIEAIIAFKLQFSNELETDWLESLVAIVDALRVQSGFTQVFGSITQNQLTSINESKAQLEAFLKVNPPAITQVTDPPCCRRFNRGHCAHPKCELPHVCGHCASPEHTIVQCKESRLAQYFQAPNNEH